MAPKLPRLGRALEVHRCVVAATSRVAPNSVPLDLLCFDRLRWNLSKINGVFGVVVHGR